jgi:hypothetical protein
MSQTVTLKAAGLNYSPNALSLTEGSLTQADDIVIRRDNTVESRRGYSDYSQPIGSTSDRAKQLIEYKNRLLVHYSNKIAFDSGTVDSNGKAIFGAFDGLCTETKTGLRIRAIEANKNLYFTSSEGIKKISAKTADDLTTAPNVITNAGAVKALNISGSLNIQQGQLSGFLPADSAAAYRVLWGKKDKNDNLLLGVPSNRITVYNYISDMTSMDITELCLLLDTINQSGCLIKSGNYSTSFYSPVNSTTATLQANVIALAAKIDNDLQYGSVSGTGVPLHISTVSLTGNVAKITFSSGDPSTVISQNDNIFLSNLPSPFNVLNGSHKVDFSPTSTYLTFTFTNADIASASPVAGNLSSYNYQTITTTGDGTFTTPLSNLILSTPATSEQERTINNTLSRISIRLKLEKTAVIPSSLQTRYISPFIITGSANSTINITIPKGIDDQYFVQVYRSRNATATDIQTLGGSGGVPVVPDDEMRLVFEDFPTAAEITAGVKVFVDTYPETLVQNNTNLYTNPQTGEGILQSNEIPPFATDINHFKNTTFYSNTKTRHRIPTFQLLGVQNISNLDKITISSTAGSDTYTFVNGVSEITGVTCLVGTSVTAGSYFEIYNPQGTKFRIWYEVNGSGSQPTQVGTICVKVPILSTFTQDQVVQTTINTINSLIYDFQVSVYVSTPHTLQILCINEGLVTNSSAGTSGFTITTIQQGNGEDSTSKQVLRSSLVSAAQAIDETAQSLVRVINRQTNGVVSAYYTSSDTTPPGQIDLEARVISDTPFYVLGSNSQIGASFNPDISPVNTTIVSNTAASSTVITTSTPHGLLNGDSIVISKSSSTPLIDGLYVVTVIDTVTFSIPVTVTVPGTTAVWSKVADTAISTNEVKPNRIYYSKANQPEAVPLLNYFPVGAEDKAILRIVPLRSSLLVFKEDGTYRVSGETAPFSTSLLDSSCVVIAPDSVGITNNIIYAWTLKGITPISEYGASAEVSRPVDTVLQKLCSELYTNFSTVTFGYGYNSDSSYTVFTNYNYADTYATIGFRYCTLTNTWTNVQRNQTCGIVMVSNDLLNLGSADANIINRERKNFNRTDYSDRDFNVNLANSSLFNNGTVLNLSSVSGVSTGDVLVQNQTLNIYDYNTLLLQLDNDPTVGLNTLSSTSGSGTVINVTTTAPHYLANGDFITLSRTNSFPSLDGTYAVSGVTTNNFNFTAVSPVMSQATSGNVKRSYGSTLTALSGDNLRDKIVQLASKLDTDPGLNTSTYSAHIASQAGTILSNSIAGSSVVTTSSPHGLVPGRIVTISGTQSPSAIPSIDGTFAVSVISSTQFSIPVNVLTAGGTGLSYSTANNLNDFNDIKACYNDIVTQLNADTGATYNSYTLVTDPTSFEAVILSVDTRLSKITVNLPLQWVVGPMTIYKAINCEFTYAPLTMGDSVNTKQIYSASFLFADRSLSTFTASFSSDLSPQFTPIVFNGVGNGIFGSYGNPGFGYGMFGGVSNSAPFITYVPANAQRCRFLNVKLNHCVARENWSLYGMALTGNVGLSNRGYR